MTPSASISRGDQILGNHWLPWATCGVRVLLMAACFFGWFGLTILIGCLLTPAQAQAEEMARDFLNGGDIVSQCAANASLPEFARCAGYVAGIADAMDNRHRINGYMACIPHVRLGDVRKGVVHVLKTLPVQLSDFGGHGLVAKALSELYPCASATSAGDASPSEAAPAPQPEQPQPDQVRVSQGTGFYVASEGLVLTNAHVIDGCSGIAATNVRGARSQAEVLARDDANDLALLKTGLNAVRIAPLRADVMLGEAVEAFGYPLSDTLATSGNFTLGNVSAVAGLWDDGRYLQISAPIQPGNSGGPLLDESGDLVGVVAGKLDDLKQLKEHGNVPQNVNFAIRASVAESFLKSHSIKYSTGEPSNQLPPTQLAVQAKEMSVLVVCH